MEATSTVLEFKCPCCNAGLRYAQGTDKFTCEYCDNTFDLETITAYQESVQGTKSEDFSWENKEEIQWDMEEQEQLQEFLCPSCGGQIFAEVTTAATFCPYCENPTILPSRLSGGIRPDSIIPFQKSKEDAKSAFLQLCKGKLLLPKEFTQEQRLEKITGMYVPFWLYDCEAQFDGSYHATRISRWSDSRYHYTKTDHFLLQREASSHFSGIPMDGSSKTDDAFMESIEPYLYDELVDFDMKYLSGFLADKYDVESKLGEARIRQRVDETMTDELQCTFLGYHSVLPTSRHLNVTHGKARYVLLPVWMLNSKYNNKIYTFAMNGQTGKMTGTFPVCPKRSAIWFAGICACVTALASLIQMLL